MPSLERKLSSSRVYFLVKKFPDAVFLTRTRWKKPLGKCELTPVFYDAGYHEVKTADKPGRYGAIVQVKTGTGQTYKQFFTLYRVDGGSGNWRLAKLKFPNP